MDEKTSIMVELILCFDNDIDMNEITREIGLSPSRSTNRKDTRNPFFNREDRPEWWKYDGEHTCGSWTIETEYIQTELLEDVLKDFLPKIHPYLERMKNVMTKYNGTAGFCIVPRICQEQTPALCFDRQFLDVVEFLNATFEIDMYL